MGQARPPLIALTGVALVVAAVGGLTFLQWSNSRVRVHSAEQAVAMAKAAYGHPQETLPVQVETEQDFWTIRLGPDQKGQMHNYVVSLWDKRAQPLVAEVTETVSLEAIRAGKR